MKYIYSLATIVVLVATVSCGNSTTSRSDALRQIEDNDSLPANVKKLVKTVAESDTAAFAGMIAYPLARPYPLHDIADMPEMEKYYGVLVDDSLRNTIVNATPADWQPYGWRGWALADGQYLWLDEESIYSVNYVSQLEKNMLDSLSRLEISTLAPSMRQGDWKPVICLKADEGPTIFRIDLNKAPAKGPAYRMAEYSSTVTMRQQPLRIFTGYIETEGSASIVTYRFTAPDGTKATFTPESPDGTSVVYITLSTKPSSAEPTSIAVTPAYWLDLLPNPQPAN